MEMEKELAELYQKLAQIIDSMIPCDWSHLYYLGEVEKGRLSCNSVFYFVTTEGNHLTRSFDVITLYGVPKDEHYDLLDEVNNILLEIYDCFIMNDQQPWEQISLSLSSSGSFNIDFFYDVMHDDDGGQPQREIGWAYETFGLEPTEGYFKRLFDDYIASKNKKP